MWLKALLFDLDGTLADTEAQGHRPAYNSAFKDLGLAWQMALESRAAIPMGSQARNLYVQHAAQGNGRRPA